MTLPVFLTRDGSMPETVEVDLKLAIYNQCTDVVNNSVPNCRVSGYLSAFVSMNFSFNLSLLLFASSSSSSSSLFGMNMSRWF